MIIMRESAFAGKRHHFMRREAAFGFAVTLIPLIGFMFFSLPPILISFFTMFTNMQGFQLNTAEWNNFQNFKDVLSDRLFGKSLLLTLVLWTSQLISLVISITTSALLAEGLRGSKAFRTIFFIPHICSTVAIAIIWMTMFNNDYGIINDIIRHLFGQNAGIEWFNKPIPFFGMIFIIVLWQSPAYGIVMLNAAFTAIPSGLYESARIDGANKWKQFWYITLPSIAPTIFFLLFAGVINGLQQFEIPQLVSSTLGNSWTGEAGPDNMGLTAMVYIYNTGLTFNNMPKAAVMSFFLFIIIVAMSILTFKLSRRWRNYE